MKNQTCKSYNKMSNEYADGIDPKLYRKTPKSVFAAIAVSFAMMIHGEGCDIDHALKLEWGVLEMNGIVPQRPPRLYSSKTEPRPDSESLQEYEHE